jgi:hypothetical protein
MYAHRLFVHREALPVGSAVSLQEKVLTMGGLPLGHQMDSGVSGFVLWRERASSFIDVLFVVSVPAHSFRSSPRESADRIFNEIWRQLALDVV